MTDGIDRVAAARELMAASRESEQVTNQLRALNQRMQEALRVAHTCNVSNVTDARLLLEGYEVAAAELQAAQERIATLEQLHRERAWHRYDDGGPDVPVLQPRYDALLEQVAALQRALEVRDVELQLAATASVTYAPAAGIVVDDEVAEQALVVFDREYLRAGAITRTEAMRRALVAMVSSATRVALVSAEPVEVTPTSYVGIVQVRDVPDAVLLYRGVERT